MSESEYDIARDLWLRQGKLREALSHALDASKLDDENADAQHLVALIYLDFCSKGGADCRLPEAEGAAKRALELRKDYREARNTLGVIQIHRKRYAEAVATLLPLTEDILYQTPENAWGNLGWAYLESGKLAEAVDALEHSVAAQPKFCVGHYRLGLARERKGQPAESVEAYSRAIETEGCGGLQEAFVGRARMLMKLGRGAEATTDLDRCIELSKATIVGKECEALRQKLK